MIALAALLAACGQTDPAIQAAVDSALAADPATADLGVDVSVSRGVVRLIGEVETRDQQQRAVAIARSTSGVRDVVDEMRLSDAAIVAAVRQALASDPVVGQVPIEVDARNGHIRLMSDQTDRDQRARAVDVASQVDGVTAVEDRMK